MLKERSFAAIRALAALALLLGSLRVFHIEFNDLAAGSLFSLGFLVLAGMAGGRLAALIGLPRLTGYLIAGLLSGPAVFAVLSHQQVNNLSLINNLALALIALQAGAEFTNDMLRKNLRSLICGTLSHIFVMAIGITALVFGVSLHYGYLGDYRGWPLLALSALLAALAVSKSPAAVVGVLSETASEGPLTDHALGIVVVLDVAVLALFSVTLVLARASVDPLSVVDLRELKLLGQELLVSVAAGFTFGFLIGLFFRFVDRERMLFVLVAAYGIAAFCRYFDYDTMLVFVAAGYVVTNFTGQGEHLIETIESMGSLVMVIFFATAGASLHIHQLMQAWQLVAIVFIGRLVLTWVSAHVGHYFARDQFPVRTYGFTPFISQAGLAIGLALIVSERFPGVGGTIAAVAISLIALNEMIGPVIFKWGLKQAGEIRNSN